jgi:hypothetical protein
VTAETWVVFELYNHYQNGHLPFSGAVIDQPAWLMSAFDTITENSFEEKKDSGRQH